MIAIRFNDRETEKRALGALSGRFAFKTWETGETAVPHEALAFLAMNDIQFAVEGPVSYERYVSPLRSAAAAEVQ